MQNNDQWNKWELTPLSLWERLMHHLKDLYWWVRYLPSKLKRCYKYAKLGWSQRAYDSAYFFQVMLFKIKEMRQHMAEHNLLLHTDRYVRQMRYAEYLLEKIIEDDFCKKEYAALEKKWGSLDIFDRPTADNPDYFEIKFTRKHCLTVEDEEKEREESRAVWKKERELREEYLDRLFRHIRKYIEQWWD